MKDKTSDIWGNESQGSRNEAAKAGELYTREELERQIAELRKRDRKTVYIGGLLAAVLLAFGTIIYVSSEANSKTFGGYNSGYSSGAYGSYAAYYDQYAVQSGGGAAAGGGCCGGGAAAAGGGCGIGGTAATDVSLTELEELALQKYKEETGRDDVTAKAGNFGCHIQIDLLDANGNIVRSYGYQGSDLYVIN